MSARNEPEEHAMTSTPQTLTVASVQVAARRLYEAEVALHDAHATQVDFWIAAAGDRLHEAIATYLAAVAASP
jgi:hypothetical protein